MFTIYGHGGHLDHMTSIMSSDFHFLVPESIHKKFGLDQSRSRNDIDLQYSHIFIKSISLRSQAAIVSEKSTFFTFSYSEAKVTKFDLAVK